MATREIPRVEWPAFLDSFSRQHRGWLSTIEVLDSKLGAQVQVREQPLAGITAELQQGDHALVSVLIGKTSDAHVAHMIPDAAHVRLKESDAGAHEALQIETSSGPTTLLSFRSAVLSEQVDGVVLD